MKTINKWTAALLAVAFAGAAHAATPVLRISGATTYEAPITKAIQDVLKSGYTFGYAGSNQYKSTAAIYSGTLASTSQAVIIKTFWSGDLSGVVDLTQQHTITQWIDNSVALSTSGTSLPSSYTTESAIPQATSAVSFSSSSAAAVSTAIGGAAIANTINNTPLVDAGTTANAAGTIGVVPFQWVLGRVSGTATQLGITNITQQDAFALIQGPVPAAFLTGSSADEHKYVFLLGRNEDAGARTVPIAEAQAGFGQNTVQYQLAFSGAGLTTQADGLVTGGTTATVTGLYLWPANSPLYTESTINWNTAGHSGYLGNADLANALSASNPTSGLTVGNAQNPTPTPSNLTNAYFIGYLGITNAATVVASGGVALSYNGVPYTVANVQSGLYSLWSFAHLYYIGSGSTQLTGTPKQAADDIADKVYITDAPTNSSGQTVAGQASAAGILFDANFLVTRAVEGGQIYQNAP